MRHPGQPAAALADMVGGGGTFLLASDLRQASDRRASNPRVGADVRPPSYGGRMVAKRFWPEWFVKEWPEMPERCAQGHELGPGRVSVSFVSCKPCPATTDGRGHHIAFCGVIGCEASEFRPVGCSGAYGPTRAEMRASGYDGRRIGRLASEDPAPRE